MSALQDHATASPSAARWIWTPRREYVNQHVYLRKRLVLPAAPAQARIRVTADTRYQLFVNGASVLRGPARGFPQALPFDELDLAPYLAAGPNVVAAHVLSFGVSTAQNVFRDRAGFFLEGAVACAGGAAVALDTGATWRVHEAAGFRKHVSRSAPQLGYQEHYDAARDTAAAPPNGPDWTAVAYDDAAWQDPHVLGAAGVLPWRTLEERGIPPLETSLLRPLRVVGQWDGQDRLPSAPPDQSSCNVAAIAALERRRPATTAWFEGTEALLAGGPARLRPVRPGDCAALIVDFGETRFGHPVLKLSGAAGGEVLDLLYSEQTAEGGVAVPPQTNGSVGGCDSSLGDRLICRAGANCFETLQARGFRYLMLVARNIRQPLTIEQLAVNEVSYPAPARGSFSCSDARLNAIWETGVRTLRHCMADVYLNAPACAQEQDWAATRIAGLAAFHALGDSALYRRGLHLMGQSLLPDGLLVGVVPSERPDCVLLDYCLHWVASLHEYHLYTGDLGPLQEHRGALEKVLGFFAILAGERGLLGPAPNYPVFLDAAPRLDRDNLSATLNLLYLHALRHAARVGNALGDSGLASHCARQAAALADRIQLTFASSRRNLLVETVDLETGEPGDLVSQHAIALAVIEGLLGKRDEDRLGPAGQVLTAMLPPPGSDSAPGPVRASLFFRAFVHEALAMLGRREDALDDIRRTWGYMLDQGAATWWERMPLRPGVAHCHAWSTHPTTFLSRHVLGLAPLEPGWKQFRVNPQPMGLSHAEGKVPTPHGEIGIACRVDPQTQRLRVELTVPRETEAHVAGPAGTEPRALGPGTHRWEA